MKIKKSIVIFWILILFSIIIIIGTYIGKWLRGSYFLPSIIIFFLLSIGLVYFTIKEKVKGNLRKFLILTGGSAAGFFVSVLLHKFLYGLNAITSHIIVLKYLTEVLHISFFFIAVFICPIGFLVGTIGSVVLLIKKKKN